MKTTSQRILMLVAAILLLAAGAQAQSARSVLDKCAGVVSNASGVSASFAMTSAQYGNAQGTIELKGQKFHIKTQQMQMWFDGKTLWTYLSKNDEVNITTPTQQQLAALNPYNFVNLYKKGYKYTMTSSATEHIVHLTANGSAESKISEAFITVDKTSSAPKELKMLVDQKWTIFTISNLRQGGVGDGALKFNAADFPDAEIIDLR